MKYCIRELRREARGKVGIQNRVWTLDLSQTAELKPTNQPTKPPTNQSTKEQTVYESLYVIQAWWCIYEIPGLGSRLEKRL